MSPNNTQTLVPIAEAALRLRMTRERVLRRVMVGSLRGAQRDGRWFVESASLPPEVRR